MTNGHDSGGGMGSCGRDVHENAPKPKRRPKPIRRVVNRDDKKTEAATVQPTTSGQ